MEITRDYCDGEESMSCKGGLSKRIMMEYINVIGITQNGNFIHNHDGEESTSRKGGIYKS